MEQQADSVTTAVPNSFTTAVPSQAINPFCNNPVPDPIHLTEDREIIVCALAALGNPTVGTPEEGLKGDRCHTSCRQTRRRYLGKLQ